MKHVKNTNMLNIDGKLWMKYRPHTTIIKVRSDSHYKVLDIRGAISNWRLYI